MNSFAHSTHLPLFAVHRLRIRRDSRLLALLGRLFCHERQGVVLCASPGAAVLFRAS